MIDVWIDTDPSIGMPRADVDDGLALVQAFHSPELRVAGVSAVFGNAPLERTWPIARELVARFGPAGLGVHRGAASATELGVETEAVRALAAALRARPLTVLAIGPVTNVAGVLVRYPELAARMERVVCVAGRRPGQLFRSTPTQDPAFPDLNFECDPPAMQVLLDARVPLVLAGWEVSSHVWITGRDLDALAAAGATGAWLAGHSRGWLAFWETELGAPGFNPFDTLAVAWLTHPELIEHFAASVRIVAGVGDAPLSLLATPAAEGSARSTYCVAPAETLKAVLLERLAGPTLPDRRYVSP